MTYRDKAFAGDRRDSVKAWALDSSGQVVSTDSAPAASADTLRIFDPQGRAKRVGIAVYSPTRPYLPITLEVVP